MKIGVCQNINCKKTFKYYPSNKSGKYCSHKCAGVEISERYKKDKKRLAQLRSICGMKKGPMSEERKKLQKQRSEKMWNDPEFRRKHSIAMVGKIKKGKNSNLWKGGIATLQNSERQKPEYKKWRKEVFERDKYTCRKCKVKGGELHAHHKKPFAKFPELRYKVDNGMTVCVGCHSKIHGRKLPSIGAVNKKKVL